MKWLLWVDTIGRGIVWGVAEARRIQRLATENGLTRCEAVAAWHLGLIKIAQRRNAPKAGRQFPVDLLRRRSERLIGGQQAVLL